ncbi:MAG: enolase C-terminal domain-like protein [Phycisphaerales bacterium]
MNRRSFLKTAGFVAAMGNYASARVLILLNIRETTTVSRIEWFLYGTGLQDTQDQPDRRCALRITAEPGIHGWADVPGWTMPDAETAGAIRSRLLGREIGSPSAIWRELYEAGLPLGVLGAVDIALWDLLGRVKNKPVHALLGTQREAVKTYVTTPFNLGDPGRYAQHALACKQAGVHGCKIRPYSDSGIGSTGSEGLAFPDRDMAVYQAVREAVGPDFACMADNGGVYTLDQALRVGGLLDDLTYEWFESPMPETEAWRERYIALAERLKTPVCAPEALADSYPPRVAWLSSRACDIGRIDASLGGFTPCIELARACESLGARLELRDLGLDAYPHLQLMAATPETLVKYVELSSVPSETRIHPGRNTPEPVVDQQGDVQFPQTPGMGIELDWDYIYAHRVA